MPLLYFRCGKCRVDGRALVSVAKMKAPHPCPVCKEPMQRSPRPISSKIVETLDNGLMSRRVERPADSERLFKERAAADNERIKNPKL